MYSYFIYNMLTGELFDCGIAETVSTIWDKTEQICALHPDLSIGVNLRYIGEETDD